MSKSITIPFFTELSSKVEATTIPLVKAVEEQRLAGDRLALAESIVDGVYDPAKYQVKLDSDPMHEPGTAYLDFGLSGAMEEFNKIAKTRMQPEAYKAWVVATLNTWRLTLAGHTNVDSIRIYVTKRHSELQAAVKDFNEQADLVKEKAVKFAAGYLTKRFNETDTTQKTAAALASMGYTAPKK